MSKNIFLIVLIVILVIIYLNKRHETYVSGSFDITLPITVDMDWKGATLSKYPYYTNNLINPPENVVNKIKNLQQYQPKNDDLTSSMYISTNMKIQPNLNDPRNREGFSMMNPYVQN